jgi:hypothetical protein
VGGTPLKAAKKLQNVQLFSERKSGLVYLTFCDFDVTVRKTFIPNVCEL